MSTIATKQGSPTPRSRLSRLHGSDETLLDQLIELESRLGAELYRHFRNITGKRLPEQYEEWKSEPSTQATAGLYDFAVHAVRKHAILTKSDQGLEVGLHAEMWLVACQLDLETFWRFCRRTSKLIGNKLRDAHESWRQARADKTADLLAYVREIGSPPAHDF